ncbi:MAG: folylpolyglutamate synthase/dihydrofolate synthase family protein, partial [Chthoniobacterales bacterium]
DGQRVIHVAGTNGKGSVCAMIEAITRAAGYRTGLFTSPHLVTFRERIQVSGEMMREDDVAAGLTLLRALVDNWDPHPTFFEIATALGLRHFAREKCEIVVLETGMGGRLDATNVVTPVVSVITPIDYDHQKWLGHTLSEIAAEKAGIIKPGVPVVSAPQRNEAESVIRTRAAECEAPLQIIATPHERQTGLAGAHQRQNAGLAVTAIEAAAIQIDQKAIRFGLTNVSWPARFQRWDAQIVIDGAHNPAGARVLAETWREVFGHRRATIILVFLRDKDGAGMIKALAPIAGRFLLPKVRTARAVSPQESAAIIRTVAPEACLGMAESFGAALADAQSGAAPILITGSLHFAGEALAALRGTPGELEDCMQ